MKKTIAVFFGGQACEHDISIITGTQLVENIDRSRYEVVPVYIARDGSWFTGKKLLDVKFMRAFRADDKEIQRVSLLPVPNKRGLIFEETKHGGLFSRNKKEEHLPIDVAIIAMHGLNGEDGTLQGLLELANIPYTSPGVLGSSVGMDKILMRTVFKGAGIPVLPGECILRSEWEKNPDQIIAYLEDIIPYPMFVKPANLGSSIGISCAKDRDSLYEALEVAVLYDRRILVEKAVMDIAEYNCSALGFDEDIRVSVCEQPVTWETFLSFDDKYMREEGKQSGGMKGMGRVLPAQIPEELTAQIQSLTGEIFRLLDCKGVVRIDFIYDKSEDRLYANEINTIPGSFAFYLWEPLGISYPRLIDMLIQFAEEAQREKNRNVFAYDSDVLKKAHFGAKS